MARQVGVRCGSLRVVRSFKVVLLVSAVGLLCLAGGFVIGNWAACTGEACSFDVDLFGALGTWIGGAGTVLALGFAGLQLSGDMEERARSRQRDEAAARKAFERAVEDAQRVRLRISMDTRTGNDSVGLGATALVVNDSNTAPAFGVLGHAHCLGQVRAKKIPPREHGARRSKNFNAERVPQPEGGWEAWEQQQLEQSWLEFEQNGYRWRRDGAEAARHIGSASG